jgi:hypothetical protein
LRRTGIIPIQGILGYDTGMNSSQIPRSPPTPDESHVKILGILSFVLAGTSLLGIAFIFFHYLIMSSMLNNSHFWDQVQAQARQQHQSAPPFNPQQFFRIFIWFYLACGAWSLVSLAANLAAGVCLLRYRARTFCLFVAGLNCINIPLGTVLGIFTLLVLLRPTVAARFQSAPAGNGAPVL